MAVSLNGDGTITGLSTLSSVTITGLTSLTTTDLTADTTTLVVDSANNRVGIGTASPSTTLQVVGTATATAFSGPLTGNVTGDVSGNAGTVTNGVYTTDIGSTVQAYDADTAKLDVAQTWTATQTYGDNVKQQFGASNDLQIFHDGSASYVSDTGTGNLILQGTNIQLRNTGDTANYLVGVDGGATSIQYNGSTKLATSNTGITVTGTVAATSYTGDGSALTGISVTPTAVSDQNNTSTGYFDLPVGTTAQRPASPTVGMVRYNTTESTYEVYKPSGWAYLTATYFPYTIEYLIVAGGAGGGGGNTNDKGGGGGGAGGMLTGSLSVTPANNYTVTVGGGGAGGGTASDGSNGGNSSFTGVTTAIGGGGGARGAGGGPFNGISGGSGGGATASGSPGGTPGSGTSGQGNAGGSNPSANNSSGGGGKGSVGGNNSGSAGGNGGSGSTWSDGNTYAGGGGGGAYLGSGGSGGSGGGGDAKGQPNPGAGNAGTSTTGGGGGGAGGRVAASGGNGGSGVVKIR